MNNQIAKLLFIDSGSGKDRLHKDNLCRSLGAVLAGSKEVWFSYKSETLEQEQETLNRISGYMDTCDVVGLMISGDFTHEMRQENSLLHNLVTRARKRHGERMHIIPIILRKTHGWQSISLLENLEPLPKDGKPIGGGRRNQDNIRAEIAKELGELVNEITNRKIEYEKKRNEYADQVFHTYQNFLEPNERINRLKSLRYTNLKKKDKAEIRKIVKQEFDRRTETYTNEFREAVFQSYPLTEDKLNYFESCQKKLGFSEMYTRTLERQIIDKYHQRQAIQQQQIQEEQNKQQQQIQEEQDNKNTLGFVAACLCSLVFFGILFGSPQTKDKKLNSASNQVQSLKSDGWLWLGAIRGDNGTSVGQNLELDVFISPPNIPSPGAIVTTVQKIRLRDGAGTGNQLVGVVEANERIQIIRVQPLVNQGYAPPFTEVWAEVHRP